MKKQDKKQQKPKTKQGKNKVKKYEKPLNLYGVEFEKLIEIALKNK